MKLRLRDDSLRLRLNRNEVAGLNETGLAESRTALSPGSALVYRVRLSPRATQPEVFFEQGVIAIDIPELAGRLWATSEEVGIYATTAWGLRIAIEKDFRCLDAGARDEDESNAYDHPGAATGKSC